jgi:toxin ParE1/3/4
MAKIRWSHEAECWFKEIYKYIAKDNLSAAEKVVTGIYDKAQLLISNSRTNFNLLKTLTI